MDNLLNTVPNYLTHFYRKGEKPFQNICDLDIQVAEKILKNDIEWRGDGTYLSARKQHEELLRSLFIKIGGKPIRKNPIYMILGDSPTGPHNLNTDYEVKVKLPLEIFKSDIISFTYPDSMYKISLSELDKLYLERNNSPRIYRLEELKDVIKKFEVYIHNNHYIEAQIWDDKPIKEFIMGKSL
ncbi:hypothetical protein [Oceanirhabdus seepicola]|uniref:Uncharacterized protein n=1 Tax=Oceanirhabdus seepicola TaxID=2828781 RepID=A0A9J6NYR0_9CLOT|nr:hypothetical protein [Oceanirhabdus seepicola]MCM1989110.1 hypothetical protein [Oceanirhabdus seepicola]